MSSVSKLLAVVATSVAASSFAEVIRDGGACDPKRFSHLERKEIVSASLHGAGLVKDPGRPFPPTRVPNHCRVHGVVRRVPGSEVNFEVWLPTAGWNGRLIGVGNGGYGGAIFMQGGLAEAIQRGYAAVSTDTGHAGTAVDTAWAYQRPQKVEDWGHRAVHLMTLRAKEIIKDYYGKPVDKSYFLGCSNGGRQGLMAAQLYPHDYDGVVAGAPAYDFTGLMTAFAWNHLVQNRAGTSVIPPSAAAMIHATVNEQCDHRDGLRDGLVTDPRNCDVDFEVLRCRAGRSKDCLNDHQLTALLEIYRGPATSSGTELYVPWPVGGEAGTNAQAGWEVWMLGTDPLQRAYVEGFFRHLLGREQWQVHDVDFDRDPPEMENRLGAFINATNTDLRAFAENGGKLIIYHGWADEAIPATGTIRYFEDVRRFMGADRVDRFARLFLVPGMHHCFSGHGPNLFNNVTAPAIPRDRFRDIAAALEAWVEEGIEPQSLIAVEAENPFEAVLDLSRAVARRTGLLCPYPKVARLRAPELDPQKASNYSCGESKQPSRSQRFSPSSGGVARGRL